MAGEMACPGCRPPLHTCGAPNQPPKCGRHPTIAATTHGGCGQELDPREVYRCVDCTTPFHRQCLMLHFTHGTEAREAHMRADQVEARRRANELAIAGSNIGHLLRAQLATHDPDCGCFPCSAVRRFRRLAAPPREEGAHGG